MPLAKQAYSSSGVSIRFHPNRHVCCCSVLFGVPCAELQFVGLELPAQHLSAWALGFCVVFFNLDPSGRRCFCPHRLLMCFGLLLLLLLLLPGRQACPACFCFFLHDESEKTARKVKAPCLLRFFHCELLHVHIHTYMVRSTFSTTWGVRKVVPVDVSLEVES